MARVKVGISHLNAVALALKATTIENQMTGNINFMTPVPDLLTFHAAVQALVSATSAAENHDSSKIEIRKLRYKELKEMMNQLAAYVQSASNGDADKILSSGFELCKLPASVGVVGQPHDLVALATLNTSEIRLHWKKVSGASAYDIECKDLGFSGDGGNTIPSPGMPSSGGTWSALQSVTSSGYTASGLASGHIYQFRVRALGASGYGAWSDLAQERAR